MAFKRFSGVGLVVVFTVAGCSSNTSTGDTSLQNGSGGSASSSTLTGPGLWATLNVDLVAKTDTAEAHTNVQGFPKDGAPLPDPLSVVAESGSCRLLAPDSPFCEPSCTATETCIGKGTDGKCVRTPVAVDMGTLTITGLTLKSATSIGTTEPSSSGSGGSPNSGSIASTGTGSSASNTNSTSFTITPIGKNYQAAGDKTVAYPPCASGSNVTFVGGADATTSFTVTAQCIEPLVATNATPVLLDPGASTTFNWAPPAVVGNSRAAVRIDISHHGGLKGLIQCDAPDNGQLVVDASLVQGLINLGTAGFPVAQLARISAATAPAGSGIAMLNIKSMTELSLKVPGVTSCTAAEDCAAGETCGNDLKCTKG